MLARIFDNKNVFRYISNTAWLGCGKFLGLGAALFISVWTARHLGPSEFGLLSFAQNFANLFVAFAALGLQKILERDLVDKDIDRQSVVSTAFYLVVLGATASYFFMFVFVEALGYDSLSKKLIMIVGLTSFLQVNIVFLAHFLSQVNAKPYAISNVIALAISNVIKIVFILTDAPLTYFAFGFVLDGLLLLPILLGIAYGTQAQPKSALASKQIAKSLLKESWPYILTGVLVTVYLKIDTIMLKEMIDAYAVGQYSAAARLSEGLYYLPIIIMSSIYPAIVKAKKLDDAIYKRRLRSLYSFLFYLGLVIAISVSVLAPNIINLLYGADYEPAVNVLLIHVWASIFVFFGMGSGRWLLTENLQLYAVANTFIGVCTNVSLNFVLIPAYGIEGAAYATIISYAASGYFSFALWRKTRPNFYLMTASIFKLPTLKA